MHCILKRDPRAPAHTRSLAIALQSLFYTQKGSKPVHLPPVQAAKLPQLYDVPVHTTKKWVWKCCELLSWLANQVQAICLFECQ